jgi:hypothetical protein
MRPSDLLARLACALLLWCGTACADDARFFARSTDYPHVLWTGLDLTVTEVERHDRWSAFALEEKKGEQSPAAAARFFACVTASVAKQRGFPSVVYLVGSSLRVNDAGADQKYVWLAAFQSARTDDVAGTVAELRGTLAEIGGKYGVKPDAESGPPVKVDEFLRSFTCPAFGRRPG